MKDHFDTVGVRTVGMSSVGDGPIDGWGVLLEGAGVSYLLLEDGFYLLQE